LGALLGTLFLMTLLVSFYSLRGDIAAEIESSERLVGILLEAHRLSRDAAKPEELAQLEALLATAPLRHLRITLGDAPAPREPMDRGSIFSRLFGLDFGGIENPQPLRIGDITLGVSPVPGSEFSERMRDTVRLCITLLLYSGATLLVAWWSAHRALSPARALETGLRRLAEGETNAALPPLLLREFRQIAQAIDQLARALVTSRAAQKRLARELIQIQENERRSLARELHDEMGQTLTALGVTAALLERNAAASDREQIVSCAGNLRRELRVGREQLRAILKNLRPHGLDAEGLAGALQELVAAWRQRGTGIDFHLVLPPRLPQIEEQSSLVVYRVVQEALTNVVRHSGAKTCQIEIRLVEPSLQVAIEDDGKGLPAEGLTRRGGLLGLEERLEMVGGRLAIASQPARGLLLTAELPLHARRAEPV
jgi:two-component system sensor histidine kinase UhpB